MQMIADPTPHARTDRVPTAPGRLTGRTIDPLADLDEIARVDSLAWAVELWARARPRTAELLRIARKTDLSLDARAIAIVLEANTSLDSKAGRRFKGQIFALLSAVMTAHVPPAKESATGRPKRRPKIRKGRRKAG